MSVGLLALFDDIASMLDSSATMTKVAAKNTAGVLGDDLAVNAEKAAGFHATREIPVLWAITKGSLLNKLIILPIAFLLSAYAPWLIIPILMLGALYLSFEGAEKVWEWLFHRGNTDETDEVIPQTPEEVLNLEKEKIRSAIRTDFILSIEIVVIALGTVTGQPLVSQIVAVSTVAMLATIGVYGIVTLLVRLDDIGLGIVHRTHEGTIMDRFGRLLVASLPPIVRLLGVVGTVAMLLVGGGIFLHNIPMLHHTMGTWPMMTAELAIGLSVGLMVFGLERLVHVIVH